MTLEVALKKVRTEQEPIFVAGSDYDDPWVQFTLPSHPESHYVRTFDYTRSVIFPVADTSATYLFTPGGSLNLTLFWSPEEDQRSTMRFSSISWILKDNSEARPILLQSLGNIPPQFGTPAKSLMTCTRCHWTPICQPANIGSSSGFTIQRPASAYVHLMKTIKYWGTS